MKKFFSLVLALVMALSLTTVAWGAPVDVPDAVDGVIQLAENTAYNGITDVAKLQNVTIKGATGATLAGIGVNGDVVGLKVVGVTFTSDLYIGTGTVEDLIVSDCVFNSCNFAVNTNWENVKIENCKFLGTTPDAHRISFYGTAPAANVVITGNTINGDIPANATTTDSRAILLGGSPSGNITISNNTMTGAFKDAIRVGAFGGDVVLAIQNNTISGTARRAATNFDSLPTTAKVWNNDWNGAKAVLNDTTESAILQDIGSGVTTDANGKFTGGTFYVDVSDNLAANTGLVYQNGVYTASSFVGNTSTLKVADGYAVYAIEGGLGTNSATATFTKVVTGNATAADGVVTYTATQYVADNGTVWNEVDVSVADSKLVNTKNGTVVAYLKYAGTSGAQIATTAVATKTVDAAVGTPECGEYAVDVVIIKGQAYAIDTTCTSGKWAVLNGKFVAYGAAQTAKPHVFTEINQVKSDKTPLNVKCDDCKAVFAVTKDVSAMVNGYQALTFTEGAGYFALIGSPASSVVVPSTDKVTSAETFDAGIAMYVGMSVLAAAGSAVVLKKKED